MKYYEFQRGHLRSEVLLGYGAVSAVDWSSILDQRSRHVLIADERVFGLHGKAVMAELLRHGDVTVIPIAEGEDGKAITEYIRIAAEISRIGCDRTSTVISLGGASTNNVAGFVAATVMRGLKLVHIPTTLLAQLDGAIDFKQAVNSDGVKNMLGAFYAPAMIVVDPSFLSTLDARQMASGYAEAIKHALIQDSDLAEFLLRSSSRSGLDLAGQAIERTITLKIAVMQSEQYERLEMLLQYGHAVGHALESVTNNALLHGEAISIGMCASAELSHRLGYCGATVVDDHVALLSAFGLPTMVPEGTSAREIMAMVRRDKYKIGGKVLLALPAGVGQAVRWGDEVCRPVDEHELEQVLRRMTTSAPTADEVALA